MLERSLITGLVLAGGRGARMGGADKGLQPYRGIALAQHALLRLSPQVSATAISANRSLADYEAMGAPVWTDALPGHPGPLAGILSGLERCATPWLAIVPCDAPEFPLDLVGRLAAALASDAGSEIALAATPHGEGLRAEPVFAVMRAGLGPALAAFMQGGGRKVEAWTAQHHTRLVRFDDERAFVNANTLEELRRLETQAGPDAPGRFPGPAP